MILSIIIFAFILMIIFSIIWFEDIRNIYLASKLPGPNLWTSLKIGINLSLQDSNKIFWMIDNFSETYGHVMCFLFGSLPIVFIENPQDIEKVIRHDPLCKRLPDVVREMGAPAFKSASLVNDGEQWKQHRKFLNNAFHNNILDTFVEGFSENSAVLAERINEFSDGSFHRLDMFVVQCTLDTVSQTSFAYNMNVQKNNNTEIIKYISILIDITTLRMLKPWLFFDLVFNRSELGREVKRAVSYMHEAVRKSFEEKTESGFYDTTESKNPTLDYTLINTSDFSELEIVEEVTGVTGAATESIALTFCFILSLLCEHPDVEEQVMEEQRCLFGDDYLRPVTKDDLLCMPYLEKVIKEAQRLFPVINFIHRTTIDDLTLTDGTVLPKGCFVLMNIFRTHRLPEHFPDPEKFDPERFSPENCLGRHPYAYLPFGSGRRMCVGYNYAIMELKTMLSTVLRRYKFLEVEGGVKGIKENLIMGITLKPKTDFYFKFVPRYHYS